MQSLRSKLLRALWQDLTHTLTIRTLISSELCPVHPQPISSGLTQVCNHTESADQTQPLTHSSWLLIGNTQRCHPECLSDIQASAVPCVTQAGLGIMGYMLHLSNLQHRNCSNLQFSPNETLACQLSATNYKMGSICLGNAASTSIGIIKRKRCNFIQPF